MEVNINVYENALGVANFFADLKKSKMLKILSFKDATYRIYDSGAFSFYHSCITQIE